MFSVIYITSDIIIVGEVCDVKSNFQTSSNSQEENVPKLRFPGFEGEYRIIVLGEIAHKIVRTDPNSNAPVMMISAASGFIKQSEKYSRNNAGQSLKKYTLIKKGELAYNHGASKFRQFGCCFELKENSARIPYVYHTFSIDKKEYAPYIALLLNNPIMDKQLKRLVSSGVRMDGLLNISYDEYMSIKLSIPISKVEQEKLYFFLEKLDQRIEKQRQLVEALKSYKRGVLSAMFSKIECKVPLYQISQYFSSANTMASIENSSYGDYPVYDARGIVAYINKYDFQNAYIAIIKDGSGIGRMHLCQSHSSIIGTLGAIFPINCTVNYLFSALQTIDFRQFASGMAIPHIYYKDYKNLLIPYPDKESRHNIEVVASQLDIIGEHENKLLNLLNNQKNSLLQQLFI